MSKMGKAWRQIRKAARDGQLSAATADLVKTVRTNAEHAATLTPMLESEQPAAAQAKFHAGFVSGIKDLVANLSKLEAALKAGDTAQATKLIDEVGDQMKSGHHDYRKPEEE